MLQGTNLIITAVLYTVAVFLTGGFVFRNNSSKVNTSVASLTTLETRVKALEEKALADLTSKIASAKLETAKAIELTKKAAEPETVAKAIETEIKKVV